MSIAQVSHLTGIPRAAARRSLHTLAKLGFVTMDEARRFYLRPRVLSFSHAYLSASPIAVLAQPILDRLGESLREAVSLATLDGDEIVYLARSATSRIMSPTLNVGRRLPVHCTSIGRIVLAHATPEEIEDYLARNQFQAFTPYTVTSREALRQILKAARQSGYATADQQLEPHFRTLAVAVRDTHGSVVAGINVIIPDERVSMEQMAARFLDPLQAAARELGSCLLPWAAPARSRA
jgi:IclR family pca regulon transcriptional regulator